MNQDLEKIQLMEELIEEGSKLYSDNELNKAEEIFLRAKELAKECNDWKQFVNLCIQLSHIYYAMGDVANEMENFFDGIQYGSENHLNDELAIIFLDIGADYLESDGIESALKYFHMAEDFKSKGEKKEDTDEVDDFELILDMNLCEVFIQKKNFSKARLYLEQAREQMNICTDRESVFCFSAFDNYALWRMGESDRVTAGINELVAIALDMDFFKNYLEGMNNLLMLLNEMKAYDLWKTTLERMESFNSTGNFNVVIYVMEQWLKYYEAVGDNVKYNEACSKYVSLMRKKKEIEKKERVLFYDQRISNKKNEMGKNAIDRQLYYDALTGIRNRNKMLKDSRRYLKFSAENRSPITIGLLDVDFFKDCNDTYGHIAGDKCLRQVASTIKECLGNKGHVYRYGGDEFLVLIRGMADKEGTLAIAEAIQEAIHKLAIPNEHAPKGIITVSQGYTAAIAEENDNIETLINLADKVLYRVKRYGRDNFMFMRISDILADIDNN